MSAEMLLHPGRVLKGAKAAYRLLGPLKSNTVFKAQRLCDSIAKPDLYARRVQGLLETGLLIIALWSRPSWDMTDPVWTVNIIVTNILQSSRAHTSEGFKMLLERSGQVTKRRRQNRKMRLA